MVRATTGCTLIQARELAAKLPSSSTVGAPHGAELAFVFGTLPPEASAEAKALSKAKSAYWVAFAKTGDPGAAGGPAWTPVTADAYGVMQFGADGPVMWPDFEKAKLDFIARLAGN